MASPIRIKRRAGGAPGAPESLLNAELAFNEVDDTLYYGKGTGGAGGSSTTVVAIGGVGAFVSKTGDQNIQGLKTFSVLPQAIGTPTNNNDLTTRAWVLAQVGASGSVHSVNVAVPTGFTVSGGPITDSGIITIGFDAGFEAFTSAQATKLAGIANNATANQTDSYLLSRANHTGTQAISTVSGLQVALDSKIPLTQRGAANGVATLDASGKVPTTQLPDSVLGGMTYKGTWNATTNNPPIPSSSDANKGWYYIVSTPGSTNIDGENDWEIGDWVVSNGTQWSKIDNSDLVDSVNGKRGEVVIDVADLASAGTMALQNSSNVDITGGKINGITIDGGTF